MTEEEKAALVKEHQELKEDMETLKKEQDDLLVLLADQDTKIESYKNKLKELGHQVGLWRIQLLLVPSRIAIT